MFQATQDNSASVISSDLGNLDTALSQEDIAKHKSEFNSGKNQTGAERVKLVLVDLDKFRRTNNLKHEGALDALLNPQDIKPDNVDASSNSVDLTLLQDEELISYALRRIYPKALDDEVEKAVTLSQYAVDIQTRTRFATEFKKKNYQKFPDENEARNEIPLEDLVSHLETHFSELIKIDMLFRKDFFDEQSPIYDEGFYQKLENAVNRRGLFKSKVFRNLMHKLGCNRSFNRINDLVRPYKIMNRIRKNLDLISSNSSN